MDLIKILIAATAACVFIVLLNQHKPEFSHIIRIVTVLLIVIAVSGSLSQVLQDVFSLSDGLQLNNEYIFILIKALIISIACRIVSDICSDTGNKSIAVCVELAGQLSVMILAIPMIAALAQLAKELIKQ